MIGTFRNAILCEDIRDEVGNKKTLVGVFSGDIVVGEFPANIRVAVYFEYLPPESSEERNLDLVLMLGDALILKLQAQIPLAKGMASLVLPQGLLTIEGETEIIVKSGSGDEMVEVLKKKIIKGNPSGVE